MIPVLPEQRAVLYPRSRMPLHHRFRRFGWVVLAGGLVLLILLMGDRIRESIDQHLRFTLFVTGASLLGVSTLAYILSPARPFGVNAATWLKTVGSAALVGFLLFVLFVHGMECELRSTGRGITSVCKQREP